ncbi:DUF922 domain-containing Zn-dependent protease [Allorhizobium borbori]|uniref:Putative secreted Zn-dependent protease n=1 Tax=Allorhizobium borbori TaxID=485907 RepID=A0A7W6K1N4_9HYPH|nr:DUF922 domain-containing protein [Allorhizobium borbori]MBB4103526.1 putative secreted Zn-dependent protease [Allorhizobium borbori]
MPLTRSLPLLLGLGLSLLTGAEIAQAETVVNKSVRYYAVGGKTTAEIDRELSRHGPMTKSTGSRHPGTTEIRFGGEISFADEGGRCRVRAVKVIVSTKITLPRWTNRNQASRDMGLLWDTLAADIKRHEERHAEIARNHARTLEARLSGLTSARTCAALQAKASEITEKTSAEHDADQARFDRVEAANFQKRLGRLLQVRIERARK